MTPSLAPHPNPNPNPTPNQVVVVYELSEQRSCLVPLRALGSSEEGGVPFAMVWQPDEP